MAPRKGKRKVPAQEVNGADPVDQENPAKMPKAAKPGDVPESRKAVTTFKLPDAAEVMEIARTQNLYKSNLFRLQLEELLKELAPRQASSKLEAFLRALKPVLLGLQQRELAANFANEFPHLCFHQRHPFPMSFKAPSRNIDIALEMPSETFQSKDYLNYRYLDKRAAYVGEVHRQLKNHKVETGSPLEGMEVMLEALHGDLYRPCVSIHLGTKAERRDAAWIVRLLPTYAPNLWPPSKLAPSRNALRPEVETNSAGPNSANPMPPTPHYNSLILEDAHMRSLMELLHHALQRLPALRDATLMFKRWALSRGLLAERSSTSVFTPLSGFAIAILAAHAGQTASIAPAQTSSLQLFKLALSVLASTDWSSHKVVFGKAVPAALSDEEQRSCKAHFYDEGENINIFWRLGPFIIDIQWEAKRALRMLDVEADPYESVFGNCASPELTWDLMVRVPLSQAGALCPSIPCKDADAGIVDSQLADAPEAMMISGALVGLLRAGLGDRCERIGVRLISHTGVRWSDQLPGATLSVLVGLTLEASNVDRIVERGPAAQDTEAATKFRSLWGKEKAELRRFKDGTILECVVWSKPPPQRRIESKKRPAVVTQIVWHLLKRHLASFAEATEIVSGPIGLVPNLGDMERRLWNTFESFRTHICQLSSLPLTVKDIYPVGGAFSYTQTTPSSAPLAPDGISRSLHPVVIEFESSGRWPEDPQAAQKVACALLLQMCEELRSDLGIETGITEEFLDVRYPEFTFRAKIFHPHELQGVAHHVTHFQAQPSSAPIEESPLHRLRTLWWQPRIRAAMHGSVLQMPALAGAVRLAKRWMGSQLLSGYDEFVEHLACSVFLQPAPFDAPSSAYSGFSRMCWLICNFDWHNAPLMVDFDGRLTEDERLAMRQSFEKRAVEVPGTTRFWISSRYDPHSMILLTPPATVCAWLQRRAKQALSICHGRVLGLDPGGPDAWRKLFVLDTTVFDIIVNLMPQDAASSSEARGRPKATKKNQQRAAVTAEATVAFVSKVKQHLSAICLVFYDLDSQMVALKWRPNAFLPQPQNNLMGAVPHTLVSQTKGQSLVCVPNIVCLTSTLASLAQGLAVNISVMGTRM